VAAFLLAYRLTGEARFLAVGEVLLDYLLLYQQCWTHPGLQNLSSSALLLGGFTTQNSDAEWSDARQSQCGNILLDYYRTTGKFEYLGRGIGVNGLNLTECTLDPGQIGLRISSPFAWKRAPVVVFRHTEPSRRYRVFVNGVEAGTWRGADLEKGVSLSLAKR
jgi:hypothetical protein